MSALVEAIDDALKTVDEVGFSRYDEFLVIEARLGQRFARGLVMVMPWKVEAVAEEVEMVVDTLVGSL